MLHTFMFGLLAIAAALLGVAMVAKNYTAPTPGAIRGPGARRMNDGGFVDVGHWVLTGLVVLTAIPAAIILLTVIIQIMAALLPTYAPAVNNLSTNFTTQNWGNATANSLGPIFGLITSLGGEFAFIGVGIVGIVFLFTAGRHGRMA